MIAKMIMWQCMMVCFVINFQTRDKFRMCLNLFKNSSSWCGAVGLHSQPDTPAPSPSVFSKSGIPRSPCSGGTWEITLKGEMMQPHPILGKLCPCCVRLYSTEGVAENTIGPRMGHPGVPFEGDNWWKRHTELILFLFRDRLCHNHLAWDISQHARKL